MFSIEDAIRRWKRNLSQRQTMTPPDIGEMETHLREEMDNLQAAGLTQEESFMVAARRIGDADEVAAEFAKVNAGAIWRGRVLWMAAGILVWHIISAAARLTTWSSVVALQYGHLPVSSFWLGVSVPVATTLLSVLLAWGLYRLAVRSSWQPDRVTARAKVLLALGVGALAIVLDVMAGLPTFVMSRIGTGQDLGQFVQGTAYGKMPIALLWPFLLAGLLIFLAHRRRPQAAG